MTEAIIEIPVISEIVEPEDVNTRRYSTEKIGHHGGVTILSRYLRAPTGSCHDICKYGVKHAVEANSLSPRAKSVPSARGEGQNLEKSEGSSGERKRKSDISLESSHDSKDQGPNGPDFIHVTTNQGQGQGQQLEKSEATSAERKKQSEISMKPSADHETEKLDGTVIVESVSVQEDQNIDIAEASSVEREKKSEITLVPSAHTKSHETDDQFFNDTASMEGRGQILEKGETSLAAGKNRPENSLKPSSDSEVEKPDDPVETDTASMEDGGQILEKGETGSPARKNMPETCLNLSSDSEVKKPGDSVVLETKQPEGADQNLEKTESNVAKRNKKLEKSAARSSHSRSQKPVGTVLIRSPLLKKETVSLKLVTSPTKKTAASMAHLRGSKQKLRPKPSSLAKQPCSSGKGIAKSGQSKEMDVLSPDSLGVSSGKSNGISRISQETRASNMDAKNAEPRSASLPSGEPGKRVPGKNADISVNIRGISHLKKYNENVKKMESRRQSNEDAESSRILKGASHLKNQLNVKKTGPDQPSCKTLDSEKKPAESIENGVQDSSVSPMLSTSSENKSFIRTQNRIPAAKSSSSSEKKNLVSGQKRVHVSGSYLSLPSPTEKRTLRLTQKGIDLIQSSSLTSPNLTPSRSSPGNASPEHYATDAERQTRRTRTPYKSKPKRANVSGSSLSLPSGKKILRRTLQGKKLLQPSPLTSPNFTPSRSSPFEASPEHYATDAERQTRRTGMSYKSKPKRVNVSGSSLSLPSPPGKKILRRTQHGKKLLQSSPLTSPKSTSSKNSPCSASPEHYATDGETQTRRTRMPYKGRPTRAELNIPKEKEWLGRKLNFKRGKVIELPSRDYTPKRLKFRRRVFADNKSEGDAGRVCFSEKESEVGQDSASDTKSDIVVLRLHDVEGKRDSKSLYNNVIEETASKLVETRKSKVKALVGAFETVISLQDTKTPSIR